MDYGARIERGQITERTADGGFIVSSLERDGIESGAVTGTDGASYEPGDRVYFFLFRDGTGKILGKM